MIDATRIITKKQREADQAKIDRETAIAAREAKYKQLTDSLVIEIIRKRFADDPDFAEVTRLAEEIHQQIPIPEP